MLPPRLALTGTFYTLAAVGVVGGFLARRRRHDYRSMALLFGLYGLAYVVLLSVN